MEIFSLGEFYRRVRTGYFVKSDPVGDSPKPKAEPVPTVPAKGDFCPNCAANVKDVSPQGVVYPKPATVNKPSKDVTLDDIAARIHRFPYLPKEQFQKLDPAEQDKHLSHDALMHLNDDEKVALKRHIRKLSEGGIARTANKLKLEEAEGYDPEMLRDEYTEKIMNLLSPALRSDYKTGNRTKAELEKEFSPDKMPTLYYGAGMNTEDMDGKRLRQVILNHSTTWPQRFFVNHPSLNDFLRKRHNAVETQRSRGQEERDVERQLEDYMKEVGVSEGEQINPAAQYTFKDLQKIAHDNGIQIVSDTDGEGNPIKITAYKESEPGKPVIDIDLKHGGKYSDFKDELAALVNNKQTSTNHPVRQYIGLEKELKEKESAHKVADSEYRELKEKYDMASVDPQVHYNRMSENGSVAGDCIENLFSGIPKELKPKVAEIYNLFSNGVEELGLEGDEDEFSVSIPKLTHGIAYLKNAVSVMEHSNLPQGNQQDVVKFVQSLVSMIKEAELLKQKATIPPQKREQLLDAMYAKMKEAEETRDQTEKDVSFIRNKTDELEATPEVSKLMKLRKEAETWRNRRENGADEEVPMSHIVPLTKLDAGGEEAGDYGDEYQHRKWMEEQNDEEEPEEVNYGDFVPYNIDFSNQKEIDTASKHLIRFLNKKMSPELVFGEKDKHSGLQRVANNIISNFVANTPENAGTRAENIIKQMGSKGEIKNKTLTSMNPYLVAKYAVLASDFSPHPIDASDFYDNKDGVFTQFGRDMYRASGNDGEPDNMASALGTKKQFSSLVEILRDIGNKLVEREFPSSSPSRGVLDKIKLLNAGVGRNKGSAGSLRRNLKRQVDYLYGIHHGKVPRHPHLNHNIKTEDDAQKWLDDVNRYYKDLYDKQNDTVEENHDDVDGDEADKWLKEHGEGNAEKSLVCETRFIVKL